MRIRVKEVGSVKKEAKYFWYPLTYEKDGKEETKKLMSFDEVPYKAFKEAKEGDQYDVKLEKDQNGYWKWKEVSVANGSSGGSNNRAFVPDDVRQRMIIRQSSLAQAVAHFKGIDGVELDTILKTAEQFEEWVNRE